MKKLSLCLLLFLVLFIAGCTSGSFVTVESHEKNTSESMTMSYKKFSGTKTKSITLSEARKVNVDITSESGSLGLFITDKDGISYFSGTDLPTSSFSVSLYKPGKYKITVKADNHRGSYSLAWMEE